MEYRARRFLSIRYYAALVRDAAVLALPLALSDVRDPQILHVMSEVAPR